MRKALVTGASSGIGRSLALALAHEGYAITAVSRNLQLLQQSVAELPGGGHVAIAADLSTPDGIELISRRLLDDKHALLVNNAGSTVYGRLEETAVQDQLRIVTLNVNAVLAPSHAFLSSAVSGDALMNVASVVGMTSLPGAATYAGTKAFVIAFSESLWYEQRKRGVYVVAFCPGVTRTNFYAAAGSQSSSFPDAMSQSAEESARAALGALRARRQPVVISGARNRAAMFASRFVDRRTIIRTLGRFSPKRDPK